MISSVCFFFFFQGGGHLLHVGGARHADWSRCRPVCILEYNSLHAASFWPESIIDLPTAEHFACCLCSSLRLHSCGRAHQLIRLHSSWWVASWIKLEWNYEGVFSACFSSFSVMEREVKEGHLGLRSNCENLSEEIRRSFWTMELLTWKQKSEERSPDFSPVMCEKEQKVFHRLFFFFLAVFPDAALPNSPAPSQSSLDLPNQHHLGPFSFSVQYAHLKINPFYSFYFQEKLSVYQMLHQTRLWTTLAGQWGSMQDHPSSISDTTSWQSTYSSSLMNIQFTPTSRVKKIYCIYPQKRGLPCLCLFFFLHCPFKFLFCLLFCMFTTDMKSYILAFIPRVCSIRSVDH